MSISACLMVYHEEKVIRECFESIKNAVDEIIVVHDGPCSDNTMKIAAEYTSKLLELPLRIGSPEPTRIHYYPLVEKKWILMIDADERLSPELAAALPDLVTVDNVEAYSFRWPFFNRDGNRIEKNIKKYKKVLYRKNKIKHIILPHLVPEVEGDEITSEFILEHHMKIPDGFFSKIKDDFKKNKKIAKIGAKNLLNNYDDIPVFGSTFRDKKLKERNKLVFIRNAPWLTILISPPLSFIYRYLAKGYWKGGLLGLSISLNIPSYYFLLSYQVIVQKVNKIFKIN